MGYCISGDWIYHLIIFFLFVALVVGLLRIWVLPYLASGDPKIAATINLIIWFLIACFVVYLCYVLFECALGGSLLPGPRLR